MKRLALLLLPVFWLSCGTNIVTWDHDDPASDTATIDGHPAWIMQGNIYEVNVRQYTPEGTFTAFAGHLDRLRDMGVQTLWFMPIQPISQKDRKGRLGSYYAIADYTATNPEFGTMDEWKSLVQQAHERGFRVIMDWVPNHTGADHRWLEKYPAFYVKDSSGNFVAPFDWTDVRKLNYGNAQMTDSMIAAMKFWVTETGIDGFRCDVAGEVPKAFWTRAIRELKQVKNLFMLAESNDAWLHEAGFDASYPWDVFVAMKQVAAGQRPATSIDSVLRRNDTAFLPNAIRMYFTSNHDENSWNKADYQTMPGPVHAPFAVLTQTLPRSVPLIYSGQEEPVRDSLSFFYKDTIAFSRFERAAFYKTLLTLRASNPALAANVPGKKLRTSNDATVYAFEREKNGNRVLVVVNLHKEPQQFTWVDRPSAGEWKNVFTGAIEPVAAGFGIEPWGYVVYELRK
ncbi:MAG TPA: alpha-amylase family glycosyl hydrolase [Flavisolibacter sp.]